MEESMTEHLFAVKTVAAGGHGPLSSPPVPTVHIASHRTYVCISNACSVD